MHTTQQLTSAQDFLGQTEDDSPATSFQMMLFDPATNSLVKTSLADAPVGGIQNNFTATVDPTATDDSAAGYEVGSQWVNVTSNTGFVCVDDTATAAVWTSTTTSGGGIQNNFTATVDPVSTDDSAAGYEVGSQWVNVTSNTGFVCVDDTATAAVWTSITTSGSDLQNNFTATVDPTATDDSAAGYEVGSQWVNVSTDTAFICVDDTATAAVWDATESGLQNNLTATVDPGSTDDSAAGYAVGSEWVNVTSDAGFICVDATATAAVWKSTTATSSGIQNNFTATVDPTATDDSAAGYETGSRWINTTSDAAFVCVDDTATAAVWTSTTSTGGGGGPQNNYTATTVPGINDDASGGYAVGSQWINVSTDTHYRCMDATAAAAVWKETTTDPLNNDLALDGYNITSDQSFRIEAAGSVIIGTGPLSIDGYDFQLTSGNAITDHTNELLRFYGVSLAVNYVQITNAATGDPAIIEAVGDDANVDLQLAAKGSLGVVEVIDTLKLTDGSRAPLRLVMRSTAPSSAVDDDVYLDDGTNTSTGQPAFRHYSSSAWNDINPPF